MRPTKTAALLALPMLWSAQAGAYSATANVVLDFGGNYGVPNNANLAAIGAPTTMNADLTWTSNGFGQSLYSMSNGTYFTTLGGHNGVNFYNSDFATAAQCAAYGPGSVRKYGCRYTTYSGTAAFARTPVADDGPVGRASGTLTVTDTSLTGTLTIVGTTDEPTGAIANITTPYGARLSTTPGNGSSGYNYRAADGSPFGNYWQGISTGGTLEFSLTGLFTATDWNITGGTMRFTDPDLLCQQGGLGALADTAAGVLCYSFGYPGVYQHNGAHLSWGWDLDGNGPNTAISEIDVRDSSGTILLDRLSGVLASISVDGAGNISTNMGEFRRANDPTTSGCGGMLRWDGTRITCGALTAGRLDMTGTVVSAVPVPGAVWLLGGALAALAALRRRVEA